MLSGRVTILFLLGILGLSLALRVNSLRMPHIENDEIIYTTLARKLVLHPLDYNLRGTPILSNLPPQMYDPPLFVHPPTVPYLLSFCFRAFGEQWSALLPALFGVGIVLGGFLIARHLYSVREALLTALILGACPINLLTSSRIWLDTALVFFSSMAFYIFIIGWDSARKRMLFLAGIVMGIAALSKYNALWLLPVMVLYAGLNPKKIRPFQKEAVAPVIVFFLGIAVLLVPWAMVYAVVMHGQSYLVYFDHSWTKEYLARFPYVVMVFRRPDYFYFISLLTLSPLYILSLLFITESEGRRKQVVLLVWIAVYLAGLIILFKMGLFAYIFRYLLPITVPLAILAARQIARWPKVLIPVMIVLGGYQLALGISNAMMPGNADVGWAQLAESFKKAY